MRSVYAAAPLVAAVLLALPNAAHAQEPNRRSPAAATAGSTQAPAEQAAPREVAVPRDTAVPRETAARASSRGESSRTAPARAASGANSADDQERRGAVRRPPSDGGGRAGGQSPRDRAVVRSGPAPRDWDRNTSRGRDRIYYYPSYWSYGRYYDPYYYGGLHLGYLAYSPWGWTPAFYGYPYSAGAPYYRGYGFGALKIKVKPRDAEVYVDGYFAGNVDDFDGVFQSLRLETGGYQIEIRKPGFETLTFDVHVQPERTVTYRGEMRATP
jgi:hypothetical protein